MKQMFIRLALVAIAALILVTATTPPQAHAIGSLNPWCWIADTSNPAVKKHCQGHDWSWPHWGGAKTYDSPDRGCGCSDIYGQAKWMTADRVNARIYPNLRPTQGVERSELVFRGAYKNVRTFRSDEMWYSWTEQVHEWVYYPSGGIGWFQFYRVGESHVVICDMNSKFKSIS